MRFVGKSRGIFGEPGPGQKDQAARDTERRDVANNEFKRSLYFMHGFRFSVWVAIDVSIFAVLYCQKVGIKPRIQVRSCPLCGEAGERALAFAGCIAESPLLPPSVAGPGPRAEAPR